MFEKKKQQQKYINAFEKKHNILFMHSKQLHLSYAL